MHEFTKSIINHQKLVNGMMQTASFSMEMELEGN
jgi:hypothetical protein